MALSEVPFYFEALLLISVSCLQRELVSQDMTDSTVTDLVHELCLLLLDFVELLDAVLHYFPALFHAARKGC